MKITKVEMWNDTGFVDGGLEVPSMTNVLPTPDITIVDVLRPAKDDLFSRLKISSVREQTGETTVFWGFEDLVNVSYVAIKYDRLDYTIYGWVDNVLMVSDSPTPVTAIDWHIDYWRTYLSKATFGYGLVTKRTRGTADPIQNVPYRYRLPGEYKAFEYTGPGNDLFWVIATYTAEDSDTSPVTMVRQMIFPVNPNAPTVNYCVSNSANTVKCPSMAQLVSAQFDEVLGISPSAITSAFVSPYPPLAVERVDGTTVYFKTTESSSSSKTITQTVQAPDRVISLSMESTWSGMTYHWTNSNGNSGSTNVDTLGDAKNWLVNNSGAVGDRRINATVNGTSTSFLWHYDLQQFISDALGDQYRPAPGDTFTISYGFYNASWDYNLVTFSDIRITASGTPLTDLILYYNSEGKWVNSEITSDNVVFWHVPKCTFAFKETSLAFDVNCVKTKGDYGYAYSANSNYPEFSVSFDEAMTTDTREWVFTDMAGSPIGTLPWGISLSGLNGRVILTSTSAYLEFRESIDSHSKGTSFSIPLPAVDITSNSWSDYVYSGQREYDISQRQIAAKQALISSVTAGLGASFQTGVFGNIGNGGVSQDQIGQLQKMMMKQYRGDKGASAISSIVGTGAGTALRAGTGMLGLSLAGAGVDYLATQYFNGQLQGAEDTLRAKQIDSITTPGNGWDWVWHGRLPGLVTLVPDDYSLNNFDNSTRLNGIACSEPMADCTDLIVAGGPLQIANLIVTGDIPVQAKNYIANKISKGVRIK